MSARPNLDLIPFDYLRFGVRGASGPPSRTTPN
jgi:hypothetical protein